jgi:hypothetical protein
MQQAYDFLDDGNLFDMTEVNDSGMEWDDDKSDDDDVNDDDYDSDDSDDEAKEEDEDEEDKEDEEAHKDDDSDGKGVGGFGVKVMYLFEKHCKKLKSDFATTCWVLSTLPHVMANAKANHDGKHQLAVKRVIDKLLANVSEEECGTKKNIFWREWDDFQGHHGESYERAYIWNASTIANGSSHLWHHQNSLQFTKVLGYVVCHVTSKILGIGTVE